MQQTSDKAMSLPLPHPSAASPRLFLIPTATKSSVRLPRLGKYKRSGRNMAGFCRWKAASGGSVSAHFKLREGPVDQSLTRRSSISSLLDTSAVTTLNGLSWLMKCVFLRGSCLFLSCLLFFLPY